MNEQRTKLDIHNQDIYLLGVFFYDKIILKREKIHKIHYF